jgi:hypothetical protein
MIKHLSLVVCALVVLAGSSVVAHHSAAEFDFQNSKELKGKVKEMRVSNPHMKLVLEITDAAKGTRDVEFEGHSRNNIYRAGWRQDLVKIGDTITIRIAPRRNGEDGGYVQNVITASGKKF